MKFRAEPKDIAIFIAFCLFLLYMICIAVLNASSLTSTGEFYGFMPFEAFSPNYIVATITFFLLALCAIFVSVGSYFFDREKGFGIVTNKKDKGYARWAKESEMKKELKPVDPKADTIEHAGLAIINDGKTMWVDDGEAHNLIIGATGSGKTQIVAKPVVKLLAKRGESIIVTDPKGEIYESTGNLLKEKGYNIIILNFRDPAKGNAWNPMTLPYQLYKEGNTDKAIELLDDLALNILYEEKSGNADPFWEKTGADYFSGLALGLFEDATEEQINLNSINLMSTLGEERFGGPNNNYIKEYFNSKDPSRPAYINASGTVFAPEETKGGILSTFKQKVKLFSSRDNLSEMLSHSDFDMHDIGKQKTAIFLIVQDEKKTLHPLATIFIKQCYETLIDVAQECGGKLPHRTNFILDEFANMPPLKDVTTMVTAARSRLIRFNFIIQNYAQLNQVYGKENAETIKGNCNQMYLISSELSALEEISKMCGEVKSKEKDKTASTPLVTVSDLQRLSQWEIIVLRMRMMPFKTKFTPDFKMDWGRQYEKATFPEHERREVKLFDIREFVKEKKKEQFMNMMDNPNGSMPGMFSGMGMNPGMGIPNIGGMNPFQTGPNQGSPNKFNVDELVKKIDAKIAALEEEERLEKEKQQENVVGKIEPQKVAVEVPRKEIKEVVKTDTKEESKKEEDVITENENLYEDNTSDDQFFDDFFVDD